MFTASLLYHARCFYLVPIRNDLYRFSIYKYTYTYMISQIIDVN